jgi:hypothetical protein
MGITRNAPPVIAETTKIVRDPDMNIDREVLAGQPIPPDLIKAYEGTAGSGKSPTTAAAVEVPDMATATDEDLDTFAKDSNVKDLVALAADDKGFAQRLVEAEQRAHGDKARAGVLKGLQAVIDAA